MDNHIHIVAFDVPYPANYGGVADVFSRITWLKKLGYKIHLHCFTSGRQPQPALADFCETVDYYRRRSPLASLSTSVPYIVQSRRSTALETALLKNDYPILLEGVHCSAILLNDAFKYRKVLLRQHNVECMYYRKLAEHETNLFKKIYFSLEARLLRKHEMKISGKALLLAINEKDLRVFTEIFQADQPVFVPCFTPWNEVKSQPGHGNYCLYHGNLSVVENEVAALWLIEEVFKHTSVKLVIAGRSPSPKLLKSADNYENVLIIIDPDDEVLDKLIKEAQVNVLPSFNNTGIKLKLLNALFNGRHCIVNPETISGTGLETLCHLAEGSQEFIALIDGLFKTDFTSAECDNRKEVLARTYNNQTNAELLSSLIR